MKFSNLSLQELMVQCTIKNSNFEESRNYVSLSHAALTVEQIVSQYKDGFKSDEESLIRCYKGYQMERDMKQRLLQICEIERIYFEDYVEISAFDGLVKGHPDFKIDGWIGDIKSVPLNEHLPSNEREVSRKIYFQCQAYLLYSGERKMVLLYESRESGFIREIWIHENFSIQKQIGEKYTEVVRRIK